VNVAFREAGAGPAVVCIHSNASSSGQWRELMDALRPKFLVFAPDSYGAGRSPPYRGASLRDEVALIEPLLGSAAALVGHSYGGAVALIAALAHRPKAMALYEPTLFSIVDPPSEVDGIRNAVAAAVTALGAGDTTGAARCFIDFWMGAGSFDRMPERVQAATAQQVRNIQGWKDALFNEPTPLASFAQLDMPVLLMVGAASPLSSRAVAKRLQSVLPRVEMLELEGLGHMAPVTHPDEVNAVIAAFLDRHAT
jgi:pimeloyl-ACP methyl ester carboxylesterase